MNLRRLFYISTGLVLFGTLVAGTWIYLTGGSDFLRGLSAVNPFYPLVLASITAYYVFARFFRWQFLLRRADVRLPTRPSLSIYLASLVGAATPAYVGEIIRCVFIRKKFNTPLKVTVLALIGERLLDVAVLALLGLLTAGTWWLRGVMVLVITGTALIGIVIGNVAKRFGVPAGLLAELDRTRNLIPAFGLSLMIWVPVTMSISIAALGVGETVPLLTGMGIFSTSTVLGGMTLMPAGVGSTGSLAIFQLQDLGIPMVASVIIVSLLRLTTVGLTMAVGAVFFVAELFALRESQTDKPIHFDEIAAEYSNQFSDHIWDHLLERKISLVTGALPDTATRGIGLDLGCGLGQQCRAMNKRGYNVVGIDAAHNLVQQARRTGVNATTGDALKLPFKDQSLDFVYTVGVLHHLPGAAAQEYVCREVARVLKPGGLFLIHETNPRNPLFRFYMGYVFPLLKSIDEGIEWWIEPHYWQGRPQLKFVDLHYFTFLPDFIPQMMMPPLLKVQTWLEGSSLRPYSVHYMAVVQRGLVEPSPAVSLQQPAHAPVNKMGRPATAARAL